MNKFHDLRARGCTSYLGQPLIRWDYPERPTTYLPLNLCVGQSPERVIRELVLRSFNILGKAARDRVAEILADVGTFPPENVISHIGWAQDYFVYANGDVAAPPNAEPMQAVFRARPGQHTQQGGVKGWKRLIGSTLVGQPLPIFAAALPLAAALGAVMGNTEGLLFEIADPAGGANVLGRIAASITGNTGPGVVPFERFLRDGEELRFTHASGLIIVEDARSELTRLTPARRGPTVIGSLQEYRRESTRTASCKPPSLLLLGAQPVADMIGDNTEAADAIASQIITLRAPLNNSFGVFRTIPKGFRTISEVTAALDDGSSRHHGRPLRVFIDRLIRDLSTDRTTLEATVKARLEKFRLNAKVDLNDPAAVTIVDKFGLVYVAAHLAVHYKIFPNEWQCGPAVLRCYRHYVDAFPVKLSAQSTTEAWANRPDAITLGKQHSVTLKDINDASIFIRTVKGRRRLMVRQRFLANLVDNEHQFLARSDVCEILIRDGRHLTRNCKLHAELPQERMYCFAMAGVT